MGAKRFLIVCICTGLVVATVLAYSPVIVADFITYDDPGYVSNNQRVLDGLTPSGWEYAWTTFDCGNWHPLTWLSLEMDGSVWKKNPAGYHVTNLVLHVFNSLLLFLILLQMTRSVFPSAVVAALFALHPLHVESVAWISERKDVLSTFFLLLTVLAYIRYAARPSVSRYIPVVAFFAAGLLAKPMLVTLPVLLMLLDVWPLDRIQWNTPDRASSTFPRQPPRRLFIEKLPLLCLALTVGLVTISAQRAATHYLRSLPFDARIANAINAYLWYLEKTFVPTNLTVFYPHPEQGISWLTVGIAAIVLAATTAVVLMAGRRRPHLFVGWGWFVISLLPVIGLLQVGTQAYADRYAYIPHIGLFMAIVWELNWWLSRSRPVRILFGAIAIAAMLGCGLLTYTQAGYWTNSDRLWTHVLDVMPDNDVAHAHLADVRFVEGNYVKALDHIERGRHIERGMRDNNPVYIANAYFNWGRCLVALDRPAEAEEKLREALKVDPNHEGTLNELSKLLEKQGRHAEATLHAEAVAKWARKQPNNPAALLSLGLAEVRRGNLDGAIIHFKKAVQLAPKSAEAHANLGLALAQANRLSEAKVCFLRVLDLNPNVAMAHFSLGQVFEEENDLPNARKHFAEAVRLDPKDDEAKKNLERLSTK